MSKLGYRAWRPGYSAETSRALHDMDSIEQETIVFHYLDLSPGITQASTYRTILRWARSG
jgi:hypothetical protein